MCGIIGFVSRSQKFTYRDITDATGAMERRGPDNGGVFLKDYQSFQVGFGHRRLSIIDLSDNASQPMQKGNCIITYNGEVYNYRELMNILHAPLNSVSDTEVVLSSYIEYGIERALNSFTGMFAFGLFDVNSKRIYVCRDRAGAKPLYYYYDENIFVFGSVLDALLKFIPRVSIDKAATGYYFQYGYVPGNYCIFSEIKKVPPGTYLELDLESHTLTSHKYWNVLDCYRDELIDDNPKEIHNALEEILESAFKSRLVADVPVGVFLSGGYDSTIVTALLAKHQSIKTFTIGFNEKEYDEAGFARSIASILGTDHHEYYCSSIEAQQLIPHLYEAYDEPFGDSSAIPTMLLSRFTRKHVKVALSADGGDEIFGGYPKHYSTKNMLSLLLKLPGIGKDWLSSLADILSNGFCHPGVKANKHLVKASVILRNRMSFFEAQALANIYTAKRELTEVLTFGDFLYGNYIKNEAHIYEELNWLSQMLAFDWNAYMVDDVLTKVDRASMYYSLEVREPFLDQRIIEFASRLPRKYKVSSNGGKRIIKDIVNKYIPKAVMARPKKGFSVPVKYWMRKELRDLFADTILSGCLKSSNLIKMPRVITELNKYFAGDKANFELLWYLFNFSLWYQKYRRYIIG